VFKHFNSEGELKDKPPRRDVDSQETPRQTIFFEIENLADAATTFFRGTYPREAPYFAWGEVRDLPWSAEYWFPTADARTVGPGPIGAEIEEIARQILEAQSASVDQHPCDQHLLTYLMPSLATPKLKMQGLAVELLLALDRFVELYHRGKIVEGLALMFEAHKYISEMTIHAEDLIAINLEKEGRRNLSKLGTDKRHAGNRELRERAIALYRAASYQSPHEASFALVDAVLAHAESIGERLSKYRAQKTIYEWLLAADKLRP
jgi:hypothetical protein